MAHSDLLTNLLTVRAAKRAQLWFKTVQLPMRLIQRHRSGWIIGLLLLFSTGSNLTLTFARSQPVVAAPATNLQIDVPTSLDPGPEPTKYRLFLPIVKRA